MRALIPLKMRWCCQITIDVAQDEALLDLMAAAGCALALIGFESLERESLAQMRKKWNGVAGSYDDVIRRFHARGIMIYGTFVFGYDADTPASFDRAAAFAREQSLCIANFNPLTPMPGTGLYDRLRDEGRLLRDRWWLDPTTATATPSSCRAACRAPSCREGPMRARRALLRLALDRASRAARRADVARSLQDRDHAARRTGSRGARSCASRAARWRPRRAAADLAEAIAMKLTLIKPTIGRMTHSLYVDEARMEPLNLGVLAALTPADVDVVMYDDRMEPIPYRRADRPGRHHGRDLHGAPLLRDRRRIPPPRRAGHHGRLPADLRPRGMRRSTRIRSSSATPRRLWATVVEDARRGATAAALSSATPGKPQTGVITRRDIYKGKGYLPISLLQFSRGCRFVATSAR